jgi:hypothetical protein
VRQPLIEGCGAGKGHLQGLIEDIRARVCVAGITKRVAKLPRATSQQRIQRHDSIDELAHWHAKQSAHGRERKEDMDARLRTSRVRQRGMGMDARHERLAGSQSYRASVATCDLDRICEVDDQHALRVRKLAPHSEASGPLPIIAIAMNLAIKLRGCRHARGAPRVHLVRIGQLHGSTLRHHHRRVLRHQLRSKRFSSWSPI